MTFVFRASEMCRWDERQFKKQNYVEKKEQRKKNV